MTKTLAGDRGVEWGWGFDHLPPGGMGKRVLDFGPMDGFYLSVDASNKGYSVTAVGVEAIQPPNPGIRYIRQDIMTVEIVGLFDYILNVSTTEHVGLGRFGDPLSPDGDLEAMSRLRTWMEPDGRQILTVPIGQDAVVGEYHRVYGHERLPRLLEGYRILEEAYWVKADDDSRWATCSKERALDEVPVMPPVSSIIKLCYALGGYVLCLT